MSLHDARESLESNQILIYFSAIAVGLLLALALGGTGWLEAWINPALGLMLFVTFLQVPLSRLRSALANTRFMGALFVANFIAVPLLVVSLSWFFPSDPLVKVAILFVLLCPCIDYVVTFSQIGKADSSLLLASTPVLLLAQMLFLPIYLSWILGASASGLVAPAPFIHAFIVLIMIPMALSAMAQLGARRSVVVERVVTLSGLSPVPATALVLMIVIAAVTPQLGAALSAAKAALPIYIIYAVAAPIVGVLIGRLFRLGDPATRALGFSAATRNSLVVLPLALAVPGALPIVPAVIVTQTLIELIASVGYMRVMPVIGRRTQRST